MENFYNDEAGVVLESFGESDMKLLEQHSNTKRVSLWFEGLEIPDLDFLAPCKCLEQVCIYGGKIGNYSALRQLPKLEILCFNGRLRRWLENFDFLSDLHSLKHLNISNYPMVTSFPSLPDLVNLEYVGLSTCKRLTDISNVLSIPNLKIFSITSMPITVQDLECIAKKPGLEKMYGIFESKRKEDEFQSMLDQYGVTNGWKHS